MPPDSSAARPSSPVRVSSSVARPCLRARSRHRATPPDRSGSRRRRRSHHCRDSPLDRPGSLPGYSSPPPKRKPRPSTPPRSVLLRSSSKGLLPRARSAGPPAMIEADAVADRRESQHQPAAGEQEIGIAGLVDRLVADLRRGIATGHLETELAGAPEAETDTAGDADVARDVLDPTRRPSCWSEYIPRPRESAPRRPVRRGATAAAVASIAAAARPEVSVRSLRIDIHTPLE